MIVVVGILENGAQHVRSKILSQAEAKLLMESAVKSGHGGLKYRHFFVIESTETDDEILDVTPWVIGIRNTKF
jgi:hypothetical protein